MKRLIQRFIDARELSTAMVEAARWGQMNMLRKLLTSGVPVNAKNRHGATALMVAGDPKVVELLIKKGADVNARDELKGNTPLQIPHRASITPQAPRCNLAQFSSTNGDATVRSSPPLDPRPAPLNPQ